jgi:hypothetical protein
MTTPRQRITAIHFTRVLIFILSTLAIILESPYGDVFGIIALAIWLWSPNIISLELKLIDKIKEKYNA